MQQTKRHLTTSNGLDYEELTEFRSEWIRPQKDAKQKILSGYFDLLYYEHNAKLATQAGVMGLIVVSVAIIFVVFHEHAVATTVVLAVLGIGGFISQQSKYQRFSEYRHKIERELRHLGVGIDDELLREGTGERTELGKLCDYPVSGLGIVCPVHAEKLTVVGRPPVYALANDNVYR